MRALAVLSLCLAVQAEEVPVVYDHFVAHFDVAALRAGEWVKYEVDRGVEGVPKTVQKWACVEADEEVAVIETDAFTGVAFPETVLRLEVSRADRRIRKAFWGKPREASKEIPVLKLDAPEPGGPAVWTQGKTTVAKECVPVGVDELTCEKKDEAVTKRARGTETKTQETTWVSPDVPFRLWVEPPPLEPDRRCSIILEGPAPVGGGLVRRVVATANGRLTWTLVAFGDDAKPTLTK